MISSKNVRELIRELNEADETEHLEAKSISSGEVGRSVYETICAMSNEPDLGGGTILLGVEKELALFPQFAVVGVGGDPEQVANDVASGCASMFNTPVRIDITREQIDAQVVVRLDVPELNPSQKPVYLKNLGLPRGAFRRIGATDQHCTDDDLTAFFQSKAQEAFDSHVVESATWEDLDLDAVEAYRRARREANPLAEELNWSDVDILHALGAVTKGPAGLQVTATGLLVFGKTAALRRISPAHRVDYIRVPGKEWAGGGVDMFESIDMRGPVLGVLSRIMAAILDDLPKTFRVDDASGRREDVPVIPARVIREAVVNAVMHRNYQTAQPVQVIRYANRLRDTQPRLLLEVSGKVWRARFRAAESTYRRDSSRNKVRGNQGERFTRNERADGSARVVCADVQLEQG